jgi:hypothetical protein
VKSPDLVVTLRFKLRRVVGGPALTTFMPCSFGLLPHPRSDASGSLSDLLRVTVVDRYVPLVTAAYGTRVARPARTTRLAPEGNGSQLA